MKKGFGRSGQLHLLQFCSWQDVEVAQVRRTKQAAIRLLL